MIRRAWMATFATAILIAPLVTSGHPALSAAAPGPPGSRAEGRAAAVRPLRALTFRDRVEVQRIVEHFARSRRIGTTESADGAISDVVLERKVRTYLGQDAALRTIWRDPVTPDDIDREWLRIVTHTRMPDRLREVVEALGADPLLVREGLVRPLLTRKRALERFALDGAIHAPERREAARLRERLIAGERDTPDLRSRLSVVTVARKSAGSEGDGPMPGARPSAAAPTADAFLVRDEFDRLRRGAPELPGTVGPLEETLDAFLFRTVLHETPDAFSLATYTVPKRGWETWWKEMEPHARGATIPATDLGEESTRPLPAIPATCQPDGSWQRIATEMAPVDARAAHAAVWTGAEMIVWFNYFTGGFRYDPLTDTWWSMSAQGAPQAIDDPRAFWTGSQLLVFHAQQTGTMARMGAYDPVSDSWSPLPNPASPTRFAPATVWTGSELILWGGSLSGSFGNSGEVFSPAENTWRPMSMAAAPDGRIGNIAIWTGTEMIVWGGDRATFPGAAGGLYNPDTDQWTAMTPSGAPEARSSHAMAWIGDRVAIWGGRHFGVPLDTGALYDPVQDSWTAMPAAPGGYANAEQTAIWTGSKLLLWGGAIVSPTDAGLAWDPATQAWSLLSLDEAPPRAVDHTAVWTGTEMVVWGGSKAAAPGLVYIAGAYDPVGDQWRTPSQPLTPVNRTGPALWTGQEMILICNASGNLYAPGSARYEPMTDSWSGLPASGLPGGTRCGGGLVWTGTEVLVWGGALQDTDPVGLAYDPVAETWRIPVPSGGSPTLAGSALVWNGTELFVVGGRRGSGSAFPGAYEVQGFAFNIRAGGSRFLPFTNSPSQRVAPSGFWTGDKLLIWGGSRTEVTPNTILNTGALYNPVAETWTTIPNSLPNTPSIRTGYAASWSGSKMLIWGGYGGASNPVARGDGATYDPALNQWTGMSTINAPSPRQSLVGFWTGKAMLVWGGLDAGSTGLSDGGRYDPALDAWTAMGTTGGPMHWINPRVWTGLFMLATDYPNPGWAYADGHSADYDGDGVQACQGDCNDFDPLAGPGMPEQCNRRDDDCDGIIPADEIDADGDGYAECAGDCRDDSAAIRPGAPEVCNHVDDDCSGSLAPDEADLDGDGVMACTGDCDDLNPEIWPGAPEQCNFTDDDCDGQRDEGLGPDTDGDGAVDCADCLPADISAHAPPAEVGNLAVVFENGSTFYMWDDQAFHAGLGTLYDVFSGSLGALRASGGDFATGTCLLPDLDFFAFEDLAPPPPVGQGVYYLVRAHNACGTSTYGSPARDQGVAASPGPCP